MAPLLSLRKCFLTTGGPTWRPKNGSEKGPPFRTQNETAALQALLSHLPEKVAKTNTCRLVRTAPPRAYAKRGGRGRTSPPALSDVDIRMPKIADSNPKRPTPARENSTFFRTVLRDAERCRNRCKRTQPTREPQPKCHPTKSRTVSPGTASGSGRHLPKHISKKRKNVPESAPVMDP